MVLGTDETRSFRPRDFQAYADRVQGRFFRTLQAYRKGARAAVPVSRRALRLLRLVGALPRPPPRRRPPLARRVDHARAGDRARGRPACGASPSSPTCRPACRCPASRAPALAGLRQQAWLQVESRDSERAAARAAAGRAPAAASRGCRRRRAGDVFFDIEGDPYWGREGLEYLFGSLTEDGYQPLWAHDRDAGARGVRALGRLDHGAAASATPTCTSTTTTTTSRPR